MTKSVSGMSAFNIILIGKTGQGKSSTGNKLLQLENYDARSSIKRFEDEEEFPVGDSPTHTCTKRPKYLVNTSTNVSVLDTPGLGATSNSHGDDSGDDSVENINYSIFREIIQYQMSLPRSTSMIHRFLYFLNVRGALTKADAYTINDLKTILHFFGHKTFKSMVIVATRDPDDGNDPLPQTMLNKTAHSFRQCLDNIGHPMECPPIIFIGIEETGAAILEKVRNVPVYVEMCLTFERGSCTKCDKNVEFYRSDDGVVVTVDLDGVSTPNCHPTLISRYTFTQKLFGTIFNLFTFGIFRFIQQYLYELPWFVPQASIQNNEEKCIKCERTRRETGCCSIGDKNDGKIIEHSPELLQHGI